MRDVIDRALASDPPLTAREWRDVSVVLRFTTSYSKVWERVSLAMLAGAFGCSERNARRRMQNLATKRLARWEPGTGDAWSIIGPGVVLGGTSPGATVSPLSRDGDSEKTPEVSPLPGQSQAASCPPRGDTDERDRVPPSTEKCFREEESRSNSNSDAAVDDNGKAKHDATDIAVRLRDRPEPVEVLTDQLLHGMQLAELGRLGVPSIVAPPTWVVDALRTAANRKAQRRRKARTGAE